LALAATVASPVFAQNEPPGGPAPPALELPPGFEPPTTGPTEQEAPPAPTAEELLADLAMASSAEEARDLERRLHTLWTRSGSATADLLFSRSSEALEEDEIEIANELLDELNALAPEFAEGWHQRAVVAMQKEEFEDAVTALQHTLSLQPKHFIAMAELGNIMEEFGDNDRALTAYREAFALNPFIEGLEERIRELSRTVEGQGI
jgi:tetratricopeptide (TPR) repeat protein